jgi:hypothetical protein
MQCNFNRSDFYYEKQCTHAYDRADIFGTGVTLHGYSDMSQAVARLAKLQLCAVLGISGIKLSEDMCTMSLLS